MNIIVVVIAFLRGVTEVLRFTALASSLLHLVEGLGSSPESRPTNLFQRQEERVIACKKTKRTKKVFLLTWQAHSLFVQGSTPTLGY